MIEPILEIQDKYFASVEAETPTGRWACLSQLCLPRPLVLKHIEPACAHSETRI